MMKIAFLSSDDSAALLSCIEAVGSGRLKAELCCLVTAKADCKAAVASRANHVRVYFFDSRVVAPEVFEDQVTGTLEFFNPDLILSENFGHTPSESFIEKFGDRLKTIDPKNPGDVVAMVSGLAK